MNIKKQYPKAWADFEKWLIIYHIDNVLYNTPRKFNFKDLTFEMQIGIYWNYFTEKDIYFHTAIEAKKWESLKKPLLHSIEQAFKIREEQLKSGK